MSTSDHTLVQSDPVHPYGRQRSTSLCLPGWLRSTSSRRPSSVWTGQHAHLISTRSSMFGTCYRWRFCDVQSNQRLSWNLQINVLVEEWNNLKMAAIQGRIGSMRRRCQTVIASRGSHTSYWQLLLLVCEVFGHVHDLE